MATLVVGTFLTVDGVMQAPGGPDEDERDGFAHGGWLVPLFDDDMGRIMVEHTLAADGLLLGRRTYEIFAEHWPRIPDDDPIAAKLNAMPKFVASRTLRSVEWRNSALLEDDAAEAVAALKRDREGEIQVTGSGDLIQTLLAADLVDEFRLWVFPVLLGTGRRLFAGGTVPAGLELVASETTGSGVAFHTYRRAGAPRYGSFRLDAAA
jgi:dihydrofolate reductase